MASQMSGIAAQAAAAYMGGGSAAALRGMSSMGGGTQGGNGGAGGEGGGLGGGAGSGGLFGGAFDLSTRSGANGYASGGGGFDGSGWSVLIGAGSQRASSSPTTDYQQALGRVGYVPDASFGLPQSFAVPRYVSAQGGGASINLSPTLLLAAVLGVVLLRR